MKSLIADFTKKESATYSPLFRNLGLDEAGVTDMMRRKEAVHLAANAAQTALLELSQE